MCPLVKEIQANKAFVCRICVTGQHRELIDPILLNFDVCPDYNLSVMKENQDLFDLTVTMLPKIKELLRFECPDLVLVHGDTTTAFVTSLACFYLKIPIGHVEAGLRTYDFRAPFPEEWNRRVIDLAATYYFAPTERARDHLLREGIPQKSIVVTGNTGIDALRTTFCSDYHHPELDWANKSRWILLTAHRRENLGDPLRKCFQAVRRITEEFDDVKVIYPVHLNPSVRQIATEELGGCEQIHLIDPLDVIDFHNFLARCFLVLTDSGGIQEEAPMLGKPVLVMRSTTERPEGILAGVARLVGNTEGSVYRGVRELLENEALYYAMSNASNPYGDGYASRRIVEYLYQEFL